MSAFTHLLLSTALAGGPGPSASRVQADPEAVGEVQRQEATAPRPASPRAIAHYLDARRLLRDGETERAVESLRLAIAHDDGSAELRLALAEALAAAGQVDAARVEAKRAATLGRGGPVAIEAQLVLARLHATSGDFDAALAAARQAVKLAAAEADAGRAPPDPEPWRVLAELQAGTGDDPGAARTLEDLAMRAPGASGGFRELGRVLLDRGDLPAAERHLRRAVDADRGDAEALRLLADVHERQRRTGAARDDLVALLGVAPDDADALLRLGRLALRDDDPAAARRWFERYVGAAEDRLDARVRVAFEWLDAERPREALAAAREAGRADDPRLKLAHGLALQGLRRWDDAAAQLGAIRASAGDLWRTARVALAVTLSRAGRHAEAERALAPALASRPGEPRLVTTEAYVLDRAGRTADAVAALRRAIAEEERAEGAADAQLYEALAETLARAGRAAEALPALRRAVAATPRDPALQYALAVACERAGQRDAAIGQLRALLALAPEHADAMNLLAYLYAERGVRLDEAESLARRALVLRPRSGYVLDSLGWVHYRRGEYGRAVEVLERADALAGPEATILEHLGDAYRAASRPVDAAGAYRRALANLADESPSRRAHARAALERKLRLLDSSAAAL